MKRTEYCGLIRPHHIGTEQICSGRVITKCDMGGVDNKPKKNVKKYATDVEAVANLARLEFSAEEMDGLQEEMDRIIAFADKLSAAPTKGVDAAEHIVPMKNVLRDDVVEDEFAAEELLAAAATKYGGYIVVPRVVED